MWQKVRLWHNVIDWATWSAVRNKQSRSLPSKQIFLLWAGTELFSALQYLLLFPTLFSFHPFFSWRSPIFRNKWHTSQARNHEHNTTNKRNLSVDCNTVHSLPLVGASSLAFPIAHGFVDILPISWQLGNKGKHLEFALLPYLGAKV